MYSQRRYFATASHISLVPAQQMQRFQMAILAEAD